MMITLKSWETYKLFEILSQPVAGSKFSVTGKYMLSDQIKENPFIKDGERFIAHRISAKQMWEWLHQENVTVEIMEMT
jgi:hypothetical protein